MITMRLRDLAFRAGEVDDVLGLAHAGTTVDTDFVGYGWCAPPAIWLDDGARCERVDAPVVVALHAADDAPALADDVLLAFVVDDGAGVAAVTALLSTFLAAWLPALPPTGPLVLAVCNPQRARLAPRLTQLAPARTWFIADGDVDSWYDEAPPRLRLHAAGWHRVGPATEGP